jgi:DnaK suppressor protein
MSARQLMLRSPRVKRCQIAILAPNARTVAVTGNFCDWVQDSHPLSHRPDGTWLTTLNLPPGRYEYRFVVDGNWQDDPTCSERIPNRFGTENCVLYVAGDPPQKRRSPMSRKEIEGYRKEILNLVAALDRSLAHDRHELLREEDPNFTGGPLPSSENRANSGAQEVELGLIANEESLLNEANAALARIEAGTFGCCESCGKAIAKARLDALPYARRCIHCARVERPAAG